MADTKNDQTAGSSRPTGGATPSKRPTATLELQATEIPTRNLVQAGANAQGKTTAAASAVEPGASEAKPSDTPAGKATASDSSGQEKQEKKGERAGPAKEGAGTLGATIAASKPGEPKSTRSSGGGFLSHTAAAIVGGLVALFGADYAATSLGVTLPSPSGERVSQLTDRLNRLEADTKERSGDQLDVEVRDRLKVFGAKLEAMTGVGASVGDLKSAQQKLAERTAALQLQLSQIQAVPGQADAALATRLEKLEATLQTLSSAASQPGDKIPQLAALTGRIADFETELDARITALRKSVSEDAQKRAADLEDKLAQSSSSVAVETLKAGTTRLSRDVETVKLGTETLDQKLQIMQSANEELRKDLGALKVGSDKLAMAIDAVKSGLDIRLASLVTTQTLTTAVAPFGDTITKIQDELSKVTKSEQTRVQSANRILLALELTNLRRAIERGDPYLAELARVKRIAPKDLDLAVLESAADKGLPTTAALTGDFRNVAASVLDADAATADGGGILEQLITSARSVIRVRRTGAVEGDSTEAVVARMEVALKAGELEGVLHEAQDLKDAAKTAAEPWLSRIAARLSVDQALASIEDGLKKSLGDAQTN